MSHGKPIYVNGEYDGDEFTVCDNCGSEIDGRSYYFDEDECPEGMKCEDELCENCYINNREEE